MSVHIDVKSESRSRSPSLVVSPSPVVRRVTIFERPEIVEGLTPVVIGAIQREIIEMRIEFEKKMEELEDRADQRIGELLQIASKERLESERMRLGGRGGNSEQWEEGSGSTRSHSDSKSSPHATK